MTPGIAALGAETVARIVRTIAVITEQRSRGFDVRIITNETLGRGCPFEPSSGAVAAVLEGLLPLGAPRDVRPCIRHPAVRHINRTISQCLLRPSLRSP